MKKISYAFYTLLLSSSFAFAQTVSTHYGTAGTAGVNVPSSMSAASATFNTPFAFLADSTGMEWIVEKDGNRLRLITNNFAIVRAGKASSQAGQANGLGVNASFNTPKGLLQLPNGDLLISDEQNNCIRKVAAYVNVGTPQEVTDYIGLKSAIGGYLDTIGSSALLSNPAGLTADEAGNIYIADAGNHAIRKYGTDGMLSTVAGTGTAGFANGTTAQARFANPTGIKYHNHVLYVADNGNKRIRMIDLTTMMVSTFAGDGDNDIDDGALASASFASPYDIATDGSSAFYVSDAAPANTIRKIINGNVSTFAGTALSTGSANGTGAVASFNNPAGLFYKSGTLYVCDADNHTIRAITAPVTQPTGLHESIQLSGALVYPNPAQGFVCIAVEAAYTRGSITLRDVAGKTMMQAALNGTLTRLGTGALQAGIYIADLEIDGLLKRQKLIIE